MAKTVVGRASIDFAGDEWLIVGCLKELGDKVLCRLRSKNQVIYSEQDGCRPVERVEMIDRNLVVKATLESVALRSGTTGIYLFGKFYSFQEGTA